jgi:predicted nuclease with TOPRIM domain
LLYDEVIILDWITQVLHKLQDELKLRNEELRAAEERMQRLGNEKNLLEQKISRFARKVEEVVMHS